MFIKLQATTHNTRSVFKGTPVDTYLQHTFTTLLAGVFRGVLVGVFGVYSTFALLALGGITRPITGVV